MDALLLAGGGEDHPFRVDGRPVAKPYLELGGEPLVRRAARAVLAARGVGRLVVVGDPGALARALAPLLADQPGRVEIVPQAGDLLGSCLRAFFQHLLPARGAARPLALGPDALGALRAAHPALQNTPVLVLASDLPFIDAADVEAFLAAVPADAAMAMGMVDHAALVRLLEGETGGGLEAWKLGGIPLWPWTVRLDNLWLFRPLLAEPALYGVIAEVYAHRWLLGRDGRILWRNWWAIVRAALGHAGRARSRARYLRGVVNFVPAVLAMAAARALAGSAPPLAWPFRRLLSRRDMETIGGWLLGAPARMVLSASPATAVDIDVEETYAWLAADGERAYRRLAGRLAR